MEEWKEGGVTVSKVESHPSGRLKGETFVLTGSLESLTRDEAKDKIRQAGGQVSESVGKKTGYLVAGDKPGSKYDKAKKLGVAIISEKELLNIIKG